MPLLLLIVVVVVDDVLLNSIYHLSRVFMWSCVSDTSVPEATHLLLEIPNNCVSSWSEAFYFPSTGLT